MSASVSRRKRPSRGPSLDRKVVSRSEKEESGSALETPCRDDGGEEASLEIPSGEGTTRLRSCRYGLRSRSRLTTSTTERIKSSPVRKRARKFTSVVTDARLEAEEAVRRLEGEFLSLEESKEPISVSSEPDPIGDENKRNEVNDDDDDAPQNLPLAVARQQAINQLHQLQASQHRVSQEAKERKRRKHDLFSLQKKQKQHQLALDRFDEEDLKKIAATLRNTEDQAHCDQPSEQKPFPPVKKAASSRKRSVGPVEVLLLEKEPPSASAASLERARAFLQSSLYGERHNRAPALTVNAMRYTTTPAANFS